MTWELVAQICTIIGFIGLVVFIVFLLLDIFLG